MRCATVLGSFSLAIVSMLASASAAETWVYGIGNNKIVAKENALTVASANLPAGVPFYVAEENFVPNTVSASSGGSGAAGYTCNILVRYGTGVVAPAGYVYYHFYPHSHKTTGTTSTTKSGTSTSGNSTKRSSGGTKNFTSTPHVRTTGTTYGRR